MTRGMSEGGIPSMTLMDTWDCDNRRDMSNDLRYSFRLSAARIVVGVISISSS
jgi:hypothetical protein